VLKRLKSSATKVTARTGPKDHSNKRTTIKARISKNPTQLVGGEGFGSGNVEDWPKSRKAGAEKWWNVEEWSQEEESVLLTE